MLHTAMFLVWSLAALTAAQLQDSSQCAGSILCCKSVQSANAVLDLTSKIGVTNAAAADLGLVGLACTPLTVIGHGKSCATKQLPVCCMDNNYNGTLSLGCNYINPMFA